MFTPEQVAHFKTFGFIVMRQYFAPEEMATISGEFDDVLATDRRGKPFPGEKRQAIIGFVHYRPQLERLLEDDRIYEPIEQLLGPGFVWMESDGNLYVGDTGWHPDSGSSDVELEYHRIKVAFYLDPVTKDTGCLRVIPGSHRQPLHRDLAPLKNAGKADGAPSFGVTPRDVPCFPLESQPGDVVFFDQNTWHAAFGGRTGRRMFTLNYGAPVTSDEHAAYLRRIYQFNLDYAQKAQFSPDGRVYTDSFLQSDRPRIHRMAAKLLELGFR